MIILGKISSKNPIVGGAGCFNSTTYCQSGAGGAGMSGQKSTGEETFGPGNGEENLHFIAAPNFRCFALPGLRLASAKEISFRTRRVPEVFSFMALS